MQELQSVISAFQKILKEVDQPEISGSFDQQFALKRFVKKFEVPDSSKANLRKELTFRNWVSYDESLTDIRLPHGMWYRARLRVQKALKGFRPGELGFTSGSQSEPLRGMQSIADKLLTHKWEVSDDCADLFVDLAINDRAIVRAAKIRMRRSMSTTEYRRTTSRIWRYNFSSRDVKKYILYWNLERRDSSRFSTVRKNNEIDRSIDLQPFVNMMVQRAIGVGLRELIKNEFDVDLIVAQEKHGSMIRDFNYATIDLKNASDSNSWGLAEFLSPKWFVELLQKACPPFTEGLDGHFYVTKKISSMGNGFTFELMTFFLLSLAREFDPTSSVYGDDIVIRTDVAEDFTKSLESGGYVVNVDKTFTSGPFRESCGHNFHESHGYVRSFDFQYPVTIEDCAVFWNKCVLLQHIPYFRSLTVRLARAVPPALRGPIPNGIKVGPTFQDDISFGSFFWWNHLKSKHKVRPSSLESLVEPLQWPEWFTHYGYEFRPKVRFARRDNIIMSKHGLLYFTYMHSGRKSDIVITGKGDWVRVAYISNGGYSIRVKSLMQVSPNFRA